MLSALLLSFALGQPPAFQAEVKIGDKELHPISEHIYGVAGLLPEKRKELAIPVMRWGGNRSTRYNWKINCDSAGSDWYFLNGGKPIRDPAESGYLKALRDNEKIGAGSYLTVPTIGWVAKDATSYGFSVKKYGPQQKREPYREDCGNGIGVNGKRITGTDPRDSSVPASPEFIAGAAKLLAANAGKQPRWYALDNEPMLWHETHRDVHPAPVGYDELWERTVKYAEAIRAADPEAKIAGFCSWGWMDLFWSAKDAGGDNYRTKADWNAHGKVPLAEWFIHKCGEYKKAHGGKPLIDVFDIHWYPQAQVNGQGPYLGKGNDPALYSLRLRTTRELWDASYKPESWIANVDAHPIALIPRIRGWIEKHNPGMELCIGEYNFGGGDNISGALAQAETFGILARERVDLAFIWTEPTGTQELAWRLFRNYDGKGARFGDRLLAAESSNPDLSAFAAKRHPGLATTIVLINKNLGSPCQASMNVSKGAGAVRMWRLDSTKGLQLVNAPQWGDDGNLKLTLPGASAALFELK